MIDVEVVAALFKHFSDESLKEIEALAQEERIRRLESAIAEAGTGACPAEAAPTL